ncbi:MAG: type II secretion system protein [Verrucomicrobiota bacterium]|jgi:type II secretory pathway pseudopilin PulG
MKQKATRAQSAFTKIELLAVIVVVGLLGFVLVAFVARPWARREALRWSCMHQMRSIGIAHLVWSGDHGDKFPSEESVSNGGWADLLTNANQGANCWTNYALMDNDLGSAPSVLICPADERTAATNFTTDFNNTHISYFVGVNADDHHPQSIVIGDRNLGPGTNPDHNYGFSPVNGAGNDVAIPISGPVSWSLKMHSAGRPAGAGNIVLGDDSGEKVTTASFNQTFLPNAPPTTNWPAAHAPDTPSIRLIFP